MPANNLGWQPPLTALIDDKGLSPALANPSERPLSRKDASRLVEFLIDYLDTTEDDPDLEDTGDDEPSLGFQAGDIFLGRGCEHGGSGDDREVEDEHDEDTCDREAVCEDEGAEHDGSEPDVDGEPSLGWTVDGAIANSDGMDREAGGSSVTEAMRQRYKPFDRYSANGNRDGKHVDAERGFGYASRRLTNLSDQQIEVVEPRLNREEVRLAR